MVKHWTEKLFIDEAKLFGETLEERKEVTEVEIDGLVGVFSEYDIPEGGMILDLACGIGRHAVPLAMRGYSVVGVDISKQFISMARNYAIENGVSGKTKFIEGDMRDVEEKLNEYREAFDVVINLFTSMGYYDEETDRSIFQQILNLVKPGGLLLIHTANRDFLVKNFQNRDFRMNEKGRGFLTERRLDLEDSRMYNVWKYYDIKGDDLIHLSTVELDHRVYSLHELKKQVEDSGWKYRACYGHFDMREFTIDTFNMVLIAQKKQKQ